MEGGGTEVLLQGEVTRAEEQVEIDAVLVDAQMLPVEASATTAGFALPDEFLPDLSRRASVSCVWNKRIFVGQRVDIGACSPRWECCV